MTNRAPLSWANIRTWFLPHSPAPTTATRSGSGPVIVMVVPSLEVPALEDQAGQDQQDRRIGDAVSRRGDEVRRLDGQPMHGLPLDVEVIEVRKRIVERVQDHLGQAFAQFCTECPQIIGEMADDIDGQRKDRDDDAEDIDACQSDVLNDLGLLAYGERAEEDRTADQEQAEEHQVVEDLIAQRLAKRVQGDHSDSVHACLTPTSFRKRSSSERLCGTSDTSRPACRRIRSTTWSVLCSSSSLINT